MKYIQLSMLCLLILFSCANAQEEAKAEATPEIPLKSQRLTQLKSMMIGSFNSGAQAAADTNYYPITLNMCLLEEQEGEWFDLYVEQYLSSTPDRPYRQRIYHVEAIDSVQYVSKILSIEGDSLLVGACSQDSLLKKAVKMSKSLKEGCDVLLSYKNGVFEGGTSGTGCLNAFGGATYATSSVRIDSLGISSWDQGFDAEGLKVWGPDVTGYTFLRE